MQYARLVFLTAVTFWICVPATTSLAQPPLQPDFTKSGDLALDGAFVDHVCAFDAGMELLFNLSASASTRMQLPPGVPPDFPVTYELYVHDSQGNRVASAVNNPYGSSQAIRIGWTPEWDGVYTVTIVNRSPAFIRYNLVVRVSDSEQSRGRSTNESRRQGTNEAAQQMNDKWVEKLLTDSNLTVSDSNQYPSADSLRSLPHWPPSYPVSGDSVAVIEIEQEGGGVQGRIIFEFYPDKAPNHVRNFKWLANHGFYNGTSFHRVIKGFMIQGGDPTGSGQGGPGWSLKAEFNDLPHVAGVVSMARKGANHDTAGSQFFIVQGDTAAHLDHLYTAFGKVLEGIEVVNEIADAPVSPPQFTSPIHAIKLKSVRIMCRRDVGL